MVTTSLSPTTISVELRSRVVRIVLPYCDANHLANGDGNVKAWERRKYQSSFCLCQRLLGKTGLLFGKRSCEMIGQMSYTDTVFRRLQLFAAKVEPLSSDKD